MRVIRALSPAGFGLLLILCLAPIGGAQEYTWIDESGRMHMTSDPTEIPARFRKKAVENAEKASSPITIVPEEKIKGQRNRYEKPKKPELTPEQKKIKQEYERLEREDRKNRPSRIGNDEKSPEEEERWRKREEAGVDLTPPEGFDLLCTYNPKTGEDNCNLIESGSSAMRREDEAREEAMDDLGADEAQVARDPELKRKVEERTRKNVQRSTPRPPASNDE